MLCLLLFLSSFKVNTYEAKPKAHIPF